MRCRHRKKTAIILVLLAGLFFSAGLYLLSSRYLTEQFRTRVQSRLEASTGLNIRLENITVSPLPFFIEAKGLNISDSAGVEKSVLSVAKVRAYIDPVAFLLRQKVLVSYLWVRGAKLDGEIGSMGIVFSSLKNQRSSAADRKKMPGLPTVGFGIRRILIEDSGFDLKDASTGVSLNFKNIRITGDGEAPYRIDVEAEDINIGYKDRPDIQAALSGNISIRPDNKVILNSLKVQSLGSEIKLQGESLEDGFSLNLDANIFMDSINKALALKGPNKGSVSVTGSLKADNGLIQGKPLEALVLDLDVKGDGYVENLFESLGILPVVQGHVSAKARIYGAVNKVEAEGELELEDGKILKLDEAYLKTKFRYAGRSLDFSDGSGRIIGGTADDIAVGIKFGKKVGYKVNCRVSDVDSIRLFRMIGWTPPHRRGGITGNVKIAGTAGDNSSIKLTGLAEYKSNGIGTALYERVTRAKAGFALDEGILVLKPVTLFGPSAEAKVAGRVDLGRKRLAIDFNAGGEEIAELISGYYQDLHGGFRLDGRVDGPFTQILVAGNISLTGGSVAGFELDSVDGDFNFLGKRLGFDHVVLRAGDAMVEAAGTVLFKAEGRQPAFGEPYFRLGADVRGLNPVPVLEVIGLKNGIEKIFDSSAYPMVSGKLNLTGSLDDFDLDLAMNSEDGKLYGQSYDRIETEISVTNDKINIRSFEARKNRSILQAAGTIGLLNTDRRYCLNFTGSDIYIDDLDIIPDELSGRISISTDCLKGDGRDGKKVDGRGMVRMQDLSYRGVELGGGELKLKLVGDKLSFKGMAIDGLCLLEGWSIFSGQPAWSVDAAFKSSDYTGIVIPFLNNLNEEPPDDLYIYGGADMSAKYLEQELSVLASIKGLDLKAYNTTFEADEPVVMSLEGRNLRFKSFSLRSGKSHFEVKGGMALGQTYDLSMAGTLNLALVRQLFPGFRGLSGEGLVDLSVTGQWNDPEVNGSLSLEGVSLSFRDMPGRLSGMKGRVVLKDKRLSIDSLTAGWGGGRLKVNGSGAFDMFSLGNFHFEAEVSNVALRPVKGLYVVFDGRMYLDSLEGEKLISGNIAFNKAVYRGRVDYKTWMVKARRKELLVPEKSWFSEAELNLHVTGVDNIRVENNIARARLKADLYLKGTVDKPGIAGRIEADGGKVFFRSHEFNILTASADFIDPHRLNPTLNVSAETWVQGYLVKLSLEGPMDQFKMMLYSDDPKLSETDILALLTVGTIGKDVENLGENIGAAEAASFLAGDLQDKIEKRFISLTGFDRFQLDPHVNKALGTMGPRVTVSKKLLSDKLFVTYSADIGTTEGQAVQLEYHLTRDVSLIGQRDELGGTGADIRVHFNFD